MKVDETESKENLRDNVKHPAHYDLPGLPVESIDVVRAVLGPEGFRKFCRGNALKYLIRADRKGGVEDLRKAERYITWEIETDGEKSKDAVNEPKPTWDVGKAIALWNAGWIVDAILDELRLDGKAPTKAQFVAYMVRHPEKFQERR